MDSERQPLSITVQRLFREEQKTKWIGIMGFISVDNFTLSRIYAYVLTFACFIFRIVAVWCYEGEVLDQSL